VVPVAAPTAPAAAPTAAPPPPPSTQTAGVSGDAAGARAKANAAGWAIQLGAFKAETEAQQATRHVVGLAVVRGKPHQVLAPGRHDQSKLYRARLLHFTEKGAQAACAELHKKKIACAVVAPSA